MYSICICQSQKGHCRHKPCRRGAVTIRRDSPLQLSQERSYICGPVEADLTKSATTLARWPSLPLPSGGHVIAPLGWKELMLGRVFRQAEGNTGKTERTQGHYTESQALNRIIQTTNNLNDLLENQCKWTNNRQNYFSSVNGTTNRERFSWIFIYVLFLISVLILDQRYSVR